MSETLTNEEIVTEWTRCEDPAYFIDTYCHVLEPSQGIDSAGAWVPFKLWDAQRDVLAAIHEHQRTVVLKPRQVGITWLVLAYILWVMVHRAIGAGLMFSRTETEAMELLDVRLKGMWERLPSWMKDGVVTDNKGHWQLDSGSSCRAFATTGGDSYTASVALIDEADLCPNLGTMLGAIEPTIDAGGKLIVISRVDKDRPDSPFKRIYKAARQGGSAYHPVFLPWTARPGRTAEWYADKRKASMDSVGSLDQVHAQYPATEEEALQPATLNKRIPTKWLDTCFKESTPLPELDHIPGVRLFAEPAPGRAYVIGADPAEGLEGGDDSALVALDAATGRQVAAFAGKLDPRAFATLANALSIYLNRAPVNCERNNHGHAVIDHLTDEGCPLVSYSDDIAGGAGLGDGRAGYPKTARSKVLIWDHAADGFRLGQLVIVDLATYYQVGSIDRKTLKGPPGAAVDDLADALTLAHAGRNSGAFWANVGAAARMW